MNTCLHESASFIPQPGLCVCMWQWTTSVSASAWLCAHWWAHAATPCVCPCGHVLQQMLPKASAVSPVMCCPLTFSNIWRCGGLLVKDSALLWLIMMLCLSLICLTSRLAIWHLHDISIYLLASSSLPQCAELVGMTPFRQRGRCHFGRNIVEVWVEELRVGDVVTCSTAF